MNIFFCLYYLGAFAIYVVSLPVLLIFIFKKKYRESIPARFFLYNNKRFKNSGGIWFHVCSLGEAKALSPILSELDSEDVKITTITHTGYHAAKEYNADVRYLPFEIFLPFWIKPQKILVVLEAEFWYLLFALMKAKGAKVILLNARISEKSVKRYMKFGWFYRKIFALVDKIYCQSEIDAYRLESLGGRNIKIIGNIKLAQKISASAIYKKPNATVVTIASTHEGEENLILPQVLKFIKAKKAKLVIVPRHPERFDGVYKILMEFSKNHGLTLGCFSENKTLNCDITLVDMMGELNNIYNISDIAIVGGSFIDKIGGHNPLEPAHFGCKIITGKYIDDQKELYKYVYHVQYAEQDSLSDALFKSQELPPSCVAQSIDLSGLVDELLHDK